MQTDLTEPTPSPFFSPCRVSSFFHPQIAVILLLANFLLHGWVLTGYFQTDDWYNIEPRSGAQVLQTFVGDWHVGQQGVGGFYRPLVRVSFSVDTLLYGTWAAGYHLTNFLFHFLTVYLFFLLCNTLLRNHWGAALGSALLFSAFPTHPEAVFWLSGRTDLMAAGFLMLCLWSYARYRLEQRRGAYWVALVAFAGALMSKETGLAGILLLGVLELLYNSGRHLGSRVLSWVRPLLPFLFILICYMFLRFLFLGGIGGYAIRPGEQAVGFSTLAQTYDAFDNTLAASFRWGLPILSKSGLLGLLILGLVLMWAVRFDRVAVFGFAWVLISILPMLKLLPSVNEGGRFVYLPAAGYCLLLGFAFWRGVQAQRVWLPGRILIGAIFIIAVLGSFTTMQAFRVLLRNPALKLHVGFDPSDDSQTVVLRVDHTYQVHREAIQEVARLHWSGEELLAWNTGEGLTLLELEEGIAETNIISQPFSGLQSPPLHMEAVWVLVVLRQKITSGQYGKIYWRGPLELYSEERSTLIYNNRRRVFQDHHRNLGYVAQLEQLLIQPTDSYSRVAIAEIDVVGYRLTSMPDGDSLVRAQEMAGE